MRYEQPVSELSKSIISQRGKFWGRQSLRNQQEFMERALVHRRVRSDEIRAELAGLEQKMDQLLCDEVEHDAKHPLSPCYRLLSHRLI